MLRLLFFSQLQIIQLLPLLSDGALQPVGQVELAAEDVVRGRLALAEVGSGLAIEMQSVRRADLQLG